MQIVEHIKCILKTMRNHFKQERIFQLFQTHLVSNLAMPGRHTISNAICFKGGENLDWTRDYRLFSKSEWDIKGCMNVILNEALQQLPETSFIPIAIDLTTLRKHGKRIPFASYQVDPLSPPFRKGLMWGQRFLHTSLILPMHNQGLPARAIPIRLEISPFVKKPGKRATPEDIEAYKIERKLNNANIQAMKLVKELTNVCQKQLNKKILIIGDGGFCNKHCFTSLPTNVDLITRCRKDAKLCYGSTEKHRFYNDQKFTPEEVRRNEDIPHQQAKVFYGGNWREVEYKDISNIYWQRGAKKRILRLIVIKPIPYRKTGSGYDCYRDPCYILTTDLTTCVEELIQAYFNRIEIEQNHRDMKNSLGLGQAQVWSETSVERHPQTIMLAYSVLLIATLKTFGPYREASEYMPPPKWYRGRLRPTIEDMRRRLRQELMNDPKSREYFGIQVPWEMVVHKLVA